MPSINSCSLPTKIICTLGPKSANEDTIKRMLDNGMSIARVNFSHGTRDTHKQVFEVLNKIREEKKYATLGVAIDTKGPEIRIGVFEKDKACIEKGSTVIITTEKEKESKCTEKMIYIDYSEIFSDLKKTLVSKIYIDDGNLELEIVSVEENKQIIQTRANTTHTLSSRKGVNIPGLCISLPGVTERDKQDIEYALDNGADFVFASFIRRPENVSEIRQIRGAEKAKIIAKIESTQGVDNIEGIVDVADGIMIARGDLAIEVDYSRVFYLQCKIASICRRKGKPFIVATQMLESLTSAVRPTRAEITDVSFAFSIGAGCTMLSAESASGVDPVNAVAVMAKLITSTAEAFANDHSLSLRLCNADNNSNYPKNEITLVSSNDKKMLRQLHILFCVQPIYCEEQECSEKDLPSLPQGYKYIRKESK